LNSGNSDCVLAVTLRRVARRVDAEYEIVFGFTALAAFDATNPNAATLSA
jgi:hypothetical protein